MRLAVSAVRPGLLAFVWAMAGHEMSAAADDPFLWLEEVDGPRALAWVKQHNEQTDRRLTLQPGFNSLRADALSALNSASRIPDVQLRGKWVYELWQDGEHPRGLFRRTTLGEFGRSQPRWETILDVDALARTEEKPWAFGGAVWLPPEYNRCLVQLAPGGTDAAEVREFDVEQREFVPNGFRLPAAKSRVAWRDRDTLYVGTDFGPDSLTTSGYPRTIKLWSRGTPLGAARTLYTAPADSVGVLAGRFEAGGEAIDFVREDITFWTQKTWQIVDGALQRLAIPPSARVVDGFNGRLVLWLREEWKTGGMDFPVGAVVIADPAALRGGPGKLDLVAAPAANATIEAVEVAAAGILITSLENVRGRLLRFVPEGASWRREVVPLPDNGSVTVTSVDQSGGEALVQFETFLTPPALYRIAVAQGGPELLQAQEPTFDGSQFEVEQDWATSADGTHVPYFVVRRKGLKRDGTAPVWMFSYGGFENSLTPSYSGSYEQTHGAYGKLWLERGGVFVLANIRGGGEFGPAWHQAALRGHRPRAFEDFEAVARDLAAKKISSPAHIGIEGRSNGGLLVATTMIRHPELYGAVVCGSPLADMKRYHRLLAGASWMAEYGNPDDPADWAFMQAFSPYQMLRPGLKLPPILIYTSMRDDRVHPGHARKLAAKMEALGYAVDYYENTEGGHHASVTHEQLADRLARTFAFLWAKLK